MFTPVSVTFATNYSAQPFEEIIGPLEQIKLYIFDINLFSRNQCIRVVRDGDTAGKSGG